MKKIALLALILFTAFPIHAQTTDKAIHDNATNVIPVVNGKVTFEETIQAEGYTANEIKDIIDKWIKERFVKPTVISAKQFTANNPKATRVEIANAFGNITADGVKYTIAKLQQKGKLKRVGGRKCGEWIVCF